MLPTQILRCVCRSMISASMQEIDWIEGKPLREISRIKEKCTVPKVRICKGFEHSDSGSRIAYIEGSSKEYVRLKP